ncbi:MAG: NAD-dependent epimerase/dehydratase family protein [Myxococcota bacterium]
MSTSLITGSSGLLGHCLIERLERRGESLRLLDLEPPAPGERAGTHKFFRADAGDVEALTRAAEGVEVIYHLAAAQRMKPQFASWSEPEIFERNLNGVRGVLQVAERCGVRKVVHLSSSGVYGIPRTNPVLEDHPKEPLGAYGRSKLQAEALCQEAIARGLDVTIFRPMSLFGPQMTGVFVMLFEWVRLGLPVYMLGRGLNRVQTVSAWDVAEACILAARAPAAAGATFNLGSAPESVPTVLETVRALVAHAGTGSPVVRIPAALVRGAARTLGLIGQSPIVPEHYRLADRDFILDIRAARETLGWAPEHDNTRMMLEAYDAYLKAGEDARQPLHPMVHLLNRLVPLPLLRALSRV